MSRQIKSISDPRLNLEILSPENVAHIHAATLEVIDKLVDDAGDNGIEPGRRLIIEDDFRIQGNRPGEG